MNQTDQYRIEVIIRQMEKGVLYRKPIYEFGDGTVIIMVVTKVLEETTETMINMDVKPDGRSKLQLIGIKLTMLYKIYNSKGDLISTNTEPTLMQIEIDAFNMTLPNEAYLVHLFVSSIGASDADTQTAFEIMFGALDDDE